MNTSAIKLTQYSHGAGCGCKISPSVLDSILSAAGKSPVKFPDLLVGNEERDDAAVLNLGDGTAVISTTDFFMPIVDDPETFGRIAATNAISDIYAMGGTPLMAIAILGWPISMLPAEVAGMVVRGAQKTCQEAKIPLAGGHSIDAPEPIFGLAVTGRVRLAHLKKNGGALPGDILLLTKPLGVGILSTAQKHDKLRPEHSHLAVEVMIRLNKAGERLGRIKGVRSMTDVTGFGLAGHLIEMCQASHTSAEIDFKALPLIDSCVLEYIQMGCLPGGTQRNYESYGQNLSLTDTAQRDIVCDPQTSGGLLIGVSPDSFAEVTSILEAEKLWTQPVGTVISQGSHAVYIR